MLSELEKLEKLDRQEKTSVQKDNDTLMRFLAEPLLYWVEKPEVEEVFMNRPHEIWLKLRKPNSYGNYWERRFEDILDLDYMTSISYNMANMAGTPKFGPGFNPVTNGALPGGHRFMVGIGQNFQYGFEPTQRGTIVFACRQNTAQKTKDFNDWGLKRNSPLAQWRPDEARRADSNDPIVKLINIMKRGEHLLISGETGVGKTSLINRLLKILPQHTRLCTVQDTPELEIPQKNHFHVLMNRQSITNNFKYRSVIDMIVRMNTDTVVYGEVSSDNAPYIIEAATTGNANFITSIHAPTSEEAVKAYIQRYEHERPLTSDARRILAEDIRKKFHIVQMYHDKATNQRRIVEIT